MSRTGRFLLGFVAIADGLWTLVTLGQKRYGSWQLSFCKWWLRPTSTRAKK